ncbi:OmpA family protein [uncultured Lacinutrix sp.]|uniref:OmpA family protein n=1 Tax=uncultured Lacinutrix sp. TaxID=574032 RepID=UPI002620E072|nr:OmpA family protein [uncultured Lacinutrix sp.]
MKNLSLILVFLFAINLTFAQDSDQDFLAEANLNENSIIPKTSIGSNGFEFTTLDVGINTKYSEYGSGFFMNKFIMVSAKKLGGLSKKDKATGEGYKNLFCLDIKDDGSLKKPLLFSRIINTYTNNEDQITFSPDEQTMYFTRSTKDNTSIYKLYKVTLEKDSHGNWIEEELLNVNTNGYSIENPFVSPNGKFLYFSSNKPGGYGGYDLYVSKIKENGSLTEVKNLGDKINTQLDDKYPSIPKDGEYLYFSSQGHDNIGGFDIFKSKIITNGFRTPINLGNTINTEYDEVAYFMASKNKGYLSSNKSLGKGRYDIYKFSVKDVAQNLEGVIVDKDSQIKLPNTLVVLFNEEGEEIARQKTKENATYNFKVNPFESYTIAIEKDGFDKANFDFTSNIRGDKTYNKKLELDATKAVIEEVEDKKMIVVNNIYFDYNKWSIKQESLISLNSIARILAEYPEMKIEINAHTDNRGNDSYNMKLSKKRAASALSYLVSKGVNRERLISHGYGETQPLIDCKTSCDDDEYQKNRRIEFIIIE